MTSRLSDKKSKVIVVDPSGPVRQMMSDVVRTGLGFETVEGRPNVQELLQYLEVDKADWVILSLMADQLVNALHLLKLCTETPELKGVRVSLFLEDDERYVVPTAFELGALSFHHKPFTKETLGEELKTLMARLEADGFKEPLTAAHYLRQHLKSSKAHAPQVELEQKLLEVYPGNPQLLMHLAEPQFLSGKKDQAKKTLAQLKLLDAHLADKVDDLAKSLFGEPIPADAATGGLNVLGVDTAVVVDSDDAVGRGVEEILKKLGVQTVHRFSDGESAWAHLEKNPEPGLMVLEWRIPKLSGPLLIQRVRQHNFLTCPIVVLSSLLKPDDMPLVREIGVASIVQKPLNKDLFVPALIFTMQQERLPTEHQAVERKIRALLKANKKDEAEPLRAQILADEHVPQAKKRLIEAEFAFAQGNYPLARDAGVESLKLAGDSIFVLNLLGKTFMRLKQHEAALKCFNKAQELAPQSIERLCNIAEANTELGNHTAAEDALSDAKDIDPDNKVVKDAEVRVAIAKGDTDSAKKLMSSMESLDSLVAYMNNKAVAYAKCGHANDAIGIYKKTLQSIPDDRTEPKAIVLYNMALAQIRESELEGALAKLDQVLKIKSTKVAKKAFSLRERLKAAIEKGAEFKLKTSDNTDPKGAPAGQAKEGEAAKLPTEEEQRQLLAAVEARRGDLCCYMIFTAGGAADARATEMLKKMPRFQLRSAIARDEALGAERMVKDSA